MTTTYSPGAQTTKIYRSRDGQYYFQFRFAWVGSFFEIYCTEHPSFNGQDDSVRKTHLYGSGKVCLVAGHEPTTLARAEELAQQWAEYFLDYRRTGVAQE